MNTRGDVEAETLIKVVLVLVLIWVVIEVLGFFLEVVEEVLEFFMPLIGLIIVVLLVLWLLDRL